jgi:hypothetical protein
MHHKQVLTVLLLASALLAAACISDEALRIDRTLMDTPPGKPNGAPPTATLPFMLSLDELMAIQNLPSSLKDAIADAMHVPAFSLGSGFANSQAYEIVRAFRTSKRPFRPDLPYPNDLYCITVYPEVGITLYLQDYVPRPGRIGINSPDDYEPGATQRGLIDHFVAIQRERSGGWELYHPEVFPWQLLCN